MGEGSTFWDAVGNVVSQNIAATPIDLTVNAEVVKLKNATNGEYFVKYQDNTFSAFATDPTMVYSNSEKVYVLVPQGNFSAKKLIIGRSSAQNNFTYAEMQELTNFYVPQSPNLVGDDYYRLDHKELAIISCPRDKRGAVQFAQGANYADYAFARWPASRIDESDFQKGATITATEQKIKDAWFEHFGDEAGNIAAPDNHINASSRFPTDFLSAKQLAKTDDLVRGWGQSWEYLGIKAKFRTEFLAEHNKGKYGIRVEYLVRNNAYNTDEEGNITSKDHRKYLTKTIEFTFDSFNGNPYAYVNDIEQVGYFKIPKGTLVGISRISLFQNDEDYNVGEREIIASDMEIDYMPVYDDTGALQHLIQYDNYTRNNIFCTELDIRWYEKKNLLNSMFLVHISSDQGNCVYNDTLEKPGVSFVNLKAHLFYGGKDILTEDDYEVHWYRECPDYRAASWPGTKKDTHNNYIASYSGDGWAPIFRPEGMTFDDAPQGLFVEEFGPWRVDDYSRPIMNGKDGHEAANYKRIDYRTMQVPRDKVPWEWYYTCVIVQKAKAEVTDNNGNVISSENDTATSYKYKPFENDMDVQGYRVFRSDSMYDLELSDLIDRAEGTQNHAYLYIKDKKDMDNTRSPSWPKKPWFGNWWYKYDGMQIGAFDNNVKNVLGGDNGKNGIVEVTRHLGHDYVQFAVGAIDPYRIEAASLELDLNALQSYLKAIDYDRYKEDEKYAEEVNRNYTEIYAAYLQSRDDLYKDNQSIISEIQESLAKWGDKIDSVQVPTTNNNVENDGSLHFTWNGDIRGLVVGILHKTIAKADGQDVIVSWEGQQHFIYNYDGTVKSWFSQDGFCVTPIVKWPKGAADFVQYRFYGPEGIGADGELKSLDYYDTKAVDAGTNTETYSLQSNTGHDPRCNSMLQNIYVETLENSLVRIHFSVRKEFNTTYAEGQNSFYLEIVLSDGNILTFECPITFSKDGSGANGSGWSVDIDSCVPPKSRTEANVSTFSRSRFLNPLVVISQKNFGDNDNRWVNYANADKYPYFPVFLRPFVYKGGYGTGARGKGYDIGVENSQITDFFDFPAELGYWAETYWSAQFGSGVTDKNLKFNSYLKFYKPDGALYTCNDWTNDTGTPLPKGLDWTGCEGSAAWTHSADGHNGAIEVRFNEDITSPDDSRYGFEFYQFIVTAMTVIYRGCEKAEQGGEFKIIPRQEGSELVTTIWSYYPVDLLVITDPTKFDPKMLDTRKLDCNWPREVLYSGTGISPAFDDPSDGLYFFYGSKKELSSDGKTEVEYFPRSLASHDFQWYPAFNLTQETQRVTYIRAGKVERDETYQQLTRFVKPEVKVYDAEYDVFGDELPDDQKVYHWEWLTQKYSPTPEIQSTNLLFGLLSTDFKNRFDYNGTDGGDGEIKTLRNDPFDGGAIFFRNQVFQLSRYSNNSVNAWNGRDIQIDNDEGSILAPTVAAGYKNPMTNDFSGVIMGIDKNQRKDGLYAAGMTSRADGVGNGKFQPSDDCFDNRQYLNTTLFEKYQEMNPYMAGVYGYQQGTPSFGLMENGTAFFGRADGGAQIVLDGSNGVIYGGGNGYLTSPSIKDPMWNSMRISLVDNTRNGYKEKIMPWKQYTEKDGLPKDMDEKTKEENAGAYTSVNVYTGQHSTKDQKDCPPTSNPVRLDFYEFFDGVNDGNYTVDSKYKLPSWYKTIWQTATVKRNNDLPYFLNVGHPCYKELPKFEDAIKAAAEDAEKRGVPFDADEALWGDSDYWINYWDNPALLNIKNKGYKQDQTSDEKNLEVENVQMTTFGYGRASTTPAIEIGQHIPGLMPGILGWCQQETIFKEFYIPGDRNFLVTYDGSLWAMNAVIMGNIIGSNIIGGRMQGVEMGVGCGGIKEPYLYQKVYDSCEWPPLIAPDFDWVSDPTLSGVLISNCGDGVPSFYTDKYGEVSCSSIRIFGGQIDIGTFHIRGKTPRVNAQGAAEDDGYGELIQYGMSDFVGLVHCYGNLGVGPNRAPKGMFGSNYGHFTQVKGQVAMGIVYSDTNVDAHKWIAKEMGMENKQYSIRRDKVAKYDYVSGEVGDANSLQQTAFFGIDASPGLPEKTTGGEAYRGHWWPMAHYYTKNPSNPEFTQYISSLKNKSVPGWFTTMNLFKSEAIATPSGIIGQAKNIQEGANYFRVGAFGTEARFIYFREKWQDEDKASLPTADDYLGWIGPVERIGGPSSNDTNWTFGMTSTRGRAMIFNSSDNMALRAIGFVELSANPKGYSIRETYKDKKMVLQPSVNRLARLQVGRAQGDSPTGTEWNDKRGQMLIETYQKGRIQIFSWITDWVGVGTDNHGYASNEKIEAGMTIDHKSDSFPLPGMILWDNCQDGSTGIRLVAGQNTGIYNHASTDCYLPFSELWLGNMLWTLSDGKGWVRGEGGHIYFEGDYQYEDHQHNIYARFA